MGADFKKTDYGGSISVSEIKNMEESPLCLKC